MNILEYENYHESKIHGEFTFPYNTYLCSIPLDFSKVPSHWHDEMEIIYIKKGEGQVTVDLQTYHVQEGSIVLILPGQIHEIDQFEEFRMEYENIIFHPDMLIPKKMDSASSKFIQPLIHGQITVPTVFTPVYPYYMDIAGPIDACDEICKTKPVGYELYIKSMLFQLFFVLESRCRNYGKVATNTKALEKIKSVIKYVENHYMEKIMIADMAALVGFSESHFMRYFKETIGTSFIDYLKEYRLTMAARLLHASDSSILDISEEVGFENLSYFNRAFKKRYHVTPSQYRKSR